MSKISKYLSHRFRFWKRLRYYRNFFNVRHPEGKKGRILLYAAIPNTYLTSYEILFYHLLRHRGYEVDYVIYDESAPLTELITQDAVEKKGKSAYWNPLVKQGKKILDAAGIRPLMVPFNMEELNALMPPEDAPSEAYFKFSIDGCHIGNHVHGVIFRYYKSTTLGPEAAPVARKFLTTALANFLFIRSLCRKNDYHAVLFSHGIYASWGPLVDYCLSTKQPFVCYDRGKTKETLNINYNQPAPVWDFPSAWERYASRQLNAEENAQVDQYFRERELQTGDVIAYNLSARQADVASLKKNLGIPEGCTTITLFSNLIWDAANVSRDIAFPSALDCIIQTISHFAGRKDVYVLLRAHPAEKVIGTVETYGGLVRQHFGNQLPENFIFLDYDLNSYNVLDISDIGVVNTSTVGLEFAMMGKPILLISETHYRGKGFTYDATSPEHFFGILEKLLEKKEILPNQVELSRKYYFMMMYRYQHKLPVRFTGKHFTDYSWPDFAALASKDAELNQILDGIENRNPDFVFWD